ALWQFPEPPTADLAALLPRLNAEVPLSAQPPRWLKRNLDGVAFSSWRDLWSGARWAAGWRGLLQAAHGALAGSSLGFRARVWSRSFSLGGRFLLQTALTLCSTCILCQKTGLLQGVVWSTWLCSKNTTSCLDPSDFLLAPIGKVQAI